MDIWKTLEQWARQRLTSLTITLVQAPEEFSQQIGQMALMQNSASNPVGPLTEAFFWEMDWKIIKPELVNIDQAGRLLETGSQVYYISPLRYERKALILGAGHVGRALADLLLFLEYEVTIMDDRKDFFNAKEGLKMIEADFDRLSELFAQNPPDLLTIVTRGHAQDTQCLRQVLNWARQPHYLGMIGSRSRTARTLKMLAEEGYAPEILDKVHAPIGLSIGAQTPAEIAVSIAAQIVEVFSSR